MRQLGTGIAFLNPTTSGATGAATINVARGRLNARCSPTLCSQPRFALQCADPSSLKHPAPLATGVERRVLDANNGPPSCGASCIVSAQRMQQLVLGTATLYGLFIHKKLRKISMLTEWHNCCYHGGFGTRSSKRYAVKETGPET